MRQQFKCISSICLVLALSATPFACLSNNIDSIKQQMLENKTPTLDFSRVSPDNIIEAGEFSPTAVTIVYSDDKQYRVSLYSQTHPIPLYKIHSWVVHIETADGKAVEDAKVYIHGGMPAHRHGLPTRPRVRKHLGNGDYLIEGLKFSMMGLWELRVNIKQPGMRDRAVFEISLPQQS